MKREEVIRVCEREVLDRTAKLYGFRKDTIQLVPGFEGCANLVYEYKRDGQSYILRISFRLDRTADQIQAELHFVNYLSENGVRVAKPLPSQNNQFLEILHVRGIPLHIVSFVKGKGMRVPENNYRYREGAPIEEYFQNWGQTLGRMHALAKDYQPVSDHVKRPTWSHLNRSPLTLETQVSERFPRIHAQIRSLSECIFSLRQDKNSYGLIHGDFNDGNFTVDYTNGDLTVFDFDDSCYFWFVYELASAWEGGIGRIMFRSLRERKNFMDHYMDQVMAGYNLENDLPVEWLDQLPMFIKLIQVEEFQHFVQYIDVPDESIQPRLSYLIKCLEDDIPFMGFLDSIYSPETPFTL